MWFLQSSGDRTHCWVEKSQVVHQWNMIKWDTAKLSMKLGSAFKVQNLWDSEVVGLFISTELFWHVFTELGKVLMKHVADRSQGLQKTTTGGKHDFNLQFICICYSVTLIWKDRIAKWSLKCEKAVYSRCWIVTECVLWSGWG